MLDLINNNLILFISLFIVIVLIVNLELKAMFGKVKKVSCDELTKLINGSKVLLIDMRTEDEYKSGHIISAKNYKMEDLDGIKINQDQTVVAYSTSEADGSKVAHQLSKINNIQTYYLEGGINSWLENNMPLTGEK